MAEKSVIFRDNQELQAADFNNQQDWITEAIDHVVNDAIETGKAYTGFTMSKSATTTITLQPGRLYAAGEVYARDETVDIDLYNSLPVVTRVQVAIVAWGQEVDEDVQPRDFLIDANTGQSQPQSVAMQTTRYCELSTVRGVEGPDPSPPSVDQSVLLLGYVVLDTSGIVSFTQALDTQLPNLALVEARTKTLETWRGILAGQIDTLRTDLAALAAKFANYVLKTDFQNLVDLVQLIYNRVFRPGVYIWYGTDQFLDTTLSDTDNTTLDSQPYNAQVNEGLRFPAGGVGWTGELELLNSNDPNALVTSGFLLPKPSGSRVRHDCYFPTHTWVEHRILQHVFWNLSCRHLHRSRHRWRCGHHFHPCPEAKVWWHQAVVDPTVHILSFVGETWEVLEWRHIAEHHEGDCDWPRHHWDRLRWWWHDWVDVHHWTKVFTNHDHSGQHVCQTFLNSQDGWLTGVTVFLMNNLAAPVDVLISQCADDGTPDHQQTIARVVLDGSAVQACLDDPIHAGDIIEDYVVKTPWHGVVGVLLGWYCYQHYHKTIPVYAYPLRIPIPPTFLAAGKRFGIHLISASDHRFAVTPHYEAFQVHCGHFWVSISGGLQLWSHSGEPHSLRFRTHFATWGRYAEGDYGTATRCEINLQSLQLAGGISSIDILAESIVPASTDLAFEVQVGSTWQKLAADPSTPDLSSNPTLLPFRAVFTGTPDLMPGVSIDPSEITLYRGAGTALRHISSEITVGTATDHIKVILKLREFDAAHHTVVAHIHHGATHKTADVVDPDDVADDGVILRVYTFNVSSVTTFQVEINGTWDGAGDGPFIVGQAIRYAT